LTERLWTRGQKKVIDPVTNRVELSTSSDQFGLSPVLPEGPLTGAEVMGVEGYELSATNSGGVTTHSDGEEMSAEDRGGASLTFTYVGVFLFCATYFFRPQDYILALAFIPLAKITGILAALSLLLVVLSGALRLRIEIKWLLALLGWLILCIPFSYWRGGSFQIVILGFGKTVVIAVAASAAVNSWSRLRRLMILQAIAMLAMGALAFGMERHSGRMYGIGNMFSDPNDFALQLCIILPFCVALLRTSASWIGKLWWLTAIFTILLAVVATYSRGGLIALIATLFFIWRRFKPTLIVVLPFLFLALLMGGVFIVRKAPSYLDRMATVTNIEADASASQRKELLIESLKQTIRHPIFGVGPGQFPQLSGFWLGTHNTYTQLSAESGIPALLLFCLLMRSALRTIRKREQDDAPNEQRDLCLGVHCALAGYLVGAVFLHTAYWLAPYLLVAYCAAASQIPRIQSAVASNSIGDGLEAGNL